jgi:heme-degrading monooxygenase HmoA
MDRRAMFARVIAAQAGAEGFDEVVRLAQHEISGAQQQPGFAGFYLLTDDEAGKLINISLWETREEMEAIARGTAARIHDEAVPETGVTSLRLETHEVECRCEPSARRPASRATSRTGTPSRRASYSGPDRGTCAARLVR